MLFFFTSILVKSETLEGKFSPMDAGTLTVLWIVAAIMILGSLTFAFMTNSAHTDSKHFFFASSFIPLIAATSYFAMASGYGVLREGSHTFFIARYIDWTITTPLLLLDLALVAMPRFPGRTAVIATLIGADIYMILTGLIAASIRSDYRWAWYGASTAAFLVILYIIVTQLRSAAAQRDPAVGRLFGTLSLMLIVLWICYPIVWALGPEGFGVINSFTDTLLYGILDVSAKVAFGFVLLSSGSVLDRVEKTEATNATGLPVFPSKG